MSDPIKSRRKKYIIDLHNNHQLAKSYITQKLDPSETAGVIARIIVDGQRLESRDVQETIEIGLSIPDVQAGLLRIVKNLKQRLLKELEHAEWDFQRDRSDYRIDESGKALERVDYFFILTEKLLAKGLIQDDSRDLRERYRKVVPTLMYFAPPNVLEKMNLPGVSSVVKEGRRCVSPSEIRRLVRVFLHIASCQECLNEFKEEMKGNPTAKSETERERALDVLFKD